MSILENTVSALQKGIQNLALQRAAENIEGWLGTLADQDFPGSDTIESNLRELHQHLQSGDVDGQVVSGLLSQLASDTQQAASHADPDSAEQLQTLGRLLDDSAQNLSR
ncbi:MAG: hypothetical protein Q4C67_00480 [Deinococcus sp.]|nr:hypothetical protein [Deinococcus sp.]